MERNHLIIIGLLAIIVILIAAIGFVLLDSTFLKESTEIKITSDHEQYEGAELSVMLVDSNRKPISNQVVIVSISDSEGNVVVDDAIKTDSEGTASLDLDLEEGYYLIIVSYRGNENYDGDNSSQRLTINAEEVVAQAPAATSSQSSSLPYSIDNLPPSNDPYPETNRYQVDEYYVIQEYVMDIEVLWT